MKPIKCRVLDRKRFVTLRCPPFIYFLTAKGIVQDFMGYPRKNRSKS